MIDPWQTLLEGEREELRFFLREEFEGEAEMSFTDSEIWAYANTILGAPQDVIDDLIASECDIADAEADEELGPEEVASLEAALAEPDFGPFTTEQLASMVDGWQAWQELQNVPPYVEREANQKEV